MGIKMKKLGGGLRVFNSFIRTSLSTLQGKWVIVAGKRHNFIVPRSIPPFSDVLGTQSKENCRE